MQANNITGFMTPKKLLTNSKNNNAKTSASNFNIKQQLFQNHNQLNPIFSPKKKQKISNTIQNSQKRLQVSKLQSKHYIDSLTKRLTFQIIEVNAHISDFQRRLTNSIQKHYQKLKIVLKESIDRIFKQHQQQIIRNYKNELKLSAPQVYFLKKDLQLMAQNIQKLRVQLESENWKSAVSQILSNEFQKKLELLIIETNAKSKLSVPIFTVNRDKLRQLQKKLQDVMILDFIRENTPQQSQYGGS